MQERGSSAPNPGLNAMLRAQYVLCCALWPLLLPSTVSVLNMHYPGCTHEVHKRPASPTFVLCAKWHTRL
eukprot:1136611-Pelagomonas_calceolata.AAC.2